VSHSHIDLLTHSYLFVGDYQRISIDSAVKDFPLPKVILMTERVPMVSARYIKNNQEKIDSFRVTFGKTNYGTRVWFLCPQCKKRVQHLYLDMSDIHDLWKCRRCIRLRYRCQLQHRNWYYEYMGKFDDKALKIEENLLKKKLRSNTKKKLQLQLESIQNMKKEMLGQYRNKKGRHYLK